ncbi:MAG: hypothetical protein JWM59_5136 [Verrucomicrobiales bacterium]|nr:hypothetical protein [Verrucomicrobiales bacterium]
MKVLIVRDRESAGGGIFNYYQAISPYLSSEHRFVNIGQPHGHYGGASSALLRITIVRLFVEWATVFWRCVWFRPDIVHVNPGMDASKCRALRRDAVTVRIALLLRRRVLVFWRGWEGSWVGKAEFPGGNQGFPAQAFRAANAQIVLASRFKEDLERWGFACPIHIETTVASDDCLKAAPAEGGQGEGIHLLFLSRVEEMKGVFELVEAYRALAARNPRYTLTIAGNGPHLEELRAYAIELGVTDVRFPGYVSGVVKAECYRAATLFCFPSAHGEGMPNAVLEAMANGLPVIASDAGGLRDILEDGLTGEILTRRGVEPRKCFDSEEIAAAIERLATDQKMRAEISAYNGAYARKRFAAPVVAGRLEAIYQSVVSGIDPSRSGAGSIEVPCGSE